ncbi:MAG: (d)CMP kinase [Methylococcaceae bacterium]|nr:(d)CMP kinase [Methylococcaceae bacterium]
MSIPVLTIDGPSGAGKGTVSRAIAKQLGWNYLDSGSIYRSLGIACLQSQTDLTNAQAVVEVAKAMILEFDCGDELKVKLNNVDITAQLGTEATGSAASVVAAISDVRAVLLQKQKDFQQPQGLVADGRDMGTVVFPNAERKVYLTASAKERAKRRYKQLIEKGIDANLAQITDEIQARDKRDMERETAPLAQADNALYLDSSDLSIPQVIDEILDFIR